MSRLPSHRLVAILSAVTFSLSVFAGPVLAQSSEPSWSSPTGSSLSWGGFQGDQIRQAFLTAAGGDAAKAQQSWEQQHQREVQALPVKTAPTQFIYTSDAHYGITRSGFRGAKDVDAHVVNAAMIDVMNALPSVTFPCNDSGVSACQKVGAVDFVVETGDIASRSETLGTTPQSYTQSAATSWSQFESDYLKGLTLTDKSGSKAPIYLAPGNHDVTNAIGFYKTMSPATDATSMAEIYNRMMKPGSARAKDSYDYAKDKVYYSIDFGGVHFQFINMWPDSAARAWLTDDLKSVAPTAPVVVFTHDQPDAESKHFTNPTPPNNINSTDKFENLLVDKFADAREVNDAAGNPIPSTIEQRDLVAFLKSHKNIVAYFHGNSNYNQYYSYTGPDNDVSLNTFRVDSPMKGEVSSKDETKLSFQVVTIDPYAQNLTVREYLWNQKAWGASTTVSLAPRAK